MYVWLFFCSNSSYCFQWSSLSDSSSNTGTIVGAVVGGIGGIIIIIVIIWMVIRKLQKDKNEKSKPELKSPDTMGFFLEVPNTTTAATKTEEDEYDITLRRAPFRIKRFIEEEKKKKEFYIFEIIEEGMEFTAGEHYQLRKKKKIGMGGYGSVFHACTASGKDYALKIFLEKKQNEQLQRLHLSKSNFLINF